MCSNENINKKEYEPFREHVTLYIYKHPKEFKIGYVQGEDKYRINRNIKFSVDTVEDFERIKSILNKKI